MLEEYVNSYIDPVSHTVDTAIDIFELYIDNCKEIPYSVYDLALEEDVLRIGYYDRQNILRLSRNFGCSYTDIFKDKNEKHHIKYLRIKEDQINKKMISDYKENNYEKEKRTCKPLRRLPY